MGLPLQATLGKSVHGFGKRSLFLSVHAITYLGKNPLVFLHTPFSLGQPPWGSIYHSALVLVLRVVKATSAGLIIASNARNCVFGCGL